MTDRSGDDPPLCDRDEAFLQALSIVYHAAEDGDGTVTFDSVRDEVSAVQWGRMLETEVLIDVGSRFVIDDPVAVQNALATTEFTPVSPDDADGEGGGRWSLGDKLAGVSAVVLVLGYQFPPIRDGVGPLVDTLLTPLTAVLPFHLVVLVLAGGTGVVSTVLQSRMRAETPATDHRERLSQIDARLAAANERGDETAVERLRDEQRELMVSQFGAFKQLLRPLAWSMLFTVPVLLWCYWFVLSPTQAVTPAATVFPLLGRIVWTAKIVGPMQAWLLWYMIWSITTRQVAQRSLSRYSASG